jgi:hypothetical protein
MKAIDESVSKFDKYQSRCALIFHNYYGRLMREEPAWGWSLTEQDLLLRLGPPALAVAFLVAFKTRRPHDERSFDENQSGQ